MVQLEDLVAKKILYFFLPHLELAVHESSTSSSLFLHESWLVIAYGKDASKIHEPWADPTILCDNGDIFNRRRTEL